MPHPYKTFRTLRPYPPLIIAESFARQFRPVLNHLYHWFD